jgi:hypothetical protein
MTWETPSRQNPRLDDPHAGIASIAECGYTTVGFVRPEHLPTCEKLGLKAIVSAGHGRVKWSSLSDEQIVAQMKSLIDASNDSPAVLGYFITDEPGTKDFPALAKAVATVKRLAPGKLAYINLYPNYATIGDPSFSQLGTKTYTEYLERFVEEVKPQFLSYDNYRVLVSNDLKDTGKAASYFQNLLEIRRVAQKHGLPFWNIAPSNQIRPFTPIPSPANLLLQAYTTLAAGGKGLTWFTYYQGNYEFGPIGRDNQRTVLWSYLKMVNEQVRVIGPMVTQLQSTGVYFTEPLPVPDLPKLPGTLVTELTSTTPMMVGEFAGTAGEKYVMIVNLSLQDSGKYQFKTSEAKTTRKYVSPVDGSRTTAPSDKAQWLTAGQGILIQLGVAENAGEKPRPAEVDVD